MSLLLIVVLAGCGQGEATSVGSEAARDLAAASPAVGSAAAASTAPDGPGVPVVPGTPPSAAAVIQPTGLEIGKIGLTARVEAVGLDPKTNDFAVPASVDLVGWYRFGPGLEATAGSVVIAGHVDSAEQGKGAFFRLRDVGPGDTFTVTGAGGLTRRYEVVAREVYDKKAIPLERYFARDGAPRLTLITCGGPFNEQTRSYRDNLVVTAKPVG